jgi:hypothetical protein
VLACACGVDGYADAPRALGLRAGEYIEAGSVPA